MTSTETILKSLEGTEIKAISINSIDNAIKFDLIENGQRRYVEFAGILEFVYSPDFTDFGPLMIVSCEYEVNLLRDIFPEINILWTFESPAIKDWLDKPVHRLKVGSADVELKLTFKELKA